jgi:hypothetical protein
MRRKSGTRAAARFVRSKSKAKRRHSTIEEFETRDLGDDIAAAGAAAVVHPQRPTSILLPPEMIAKLKARAGRLGIGYQTLLKMIVAKHIDDEL